MSIPAFLRNLLLIGMTWTIMLFVVFFISQKAPHQVVENICQKCSSLGSYTTVASEDKKCLSEKLNLHLPLFYFELSTLAQPDTFYRLTSPKERKALGWLLQQSGNWEAVQTYFLTLKTDLDSSYHPVLEGLLYYPWDKSIYLSHLGQDMKAEDLSFEGYALQLDSLAHSKLWWRAYIPRIHFHGLRNQFHQWLYQLFIKQEIGISYQHLDCRACSCYAPDSVSVRPISFQKPLTRTFILAFFSTTLGLGLSLIVALFLVLYQDKFWAKAGNQVLIFWEAIPLYGIGVWAFIALRVSPFQERNTLIEELLLKENLQVFGLSILILTSASLPLLVRIVRSGLLEERNKGYFTTALAKGLSTGKALIFHAFPNLMTRLITLYVLWFSSFLNGSVILEAIFDIPGMGQLILGAALSADLQPLMLAMMFLGFFAISSYYLADYLSSKWDPRIRRPSKL